MDPKRLNDGLHEVATDVETPPIHEFSVRTSKEWLGLKELTRYADISQRTLRSWIYSAVDPLPAAKVCGKVLSVKRWIAELADRGLARNTIRLAVSTLRAVINAAIEDGLMGFNPAQKLGRLVKAEEPRHPASSLSSKEADRFVTSVKEHRPRHYAFFLTALRAGLRAGELLALRWGDVQFGESDGDSNRYILVRHNYDRRSRRFLTPKSKRPRRVDLGRELRNVLLELHDQRMLAAFGRGQDSVADELVFPSEKGTVLNLSNVVRRHFLPALNRAGLRRIRFHDLRHTFGSLLIQAGAPLTYVRDQMGYSSIKITVDIYGHMMPGANIAYMDRLDNVKGPTTPQNPQPPRNLRGGTLAAAVSK